MVYTPVPDTHHKIERPPRVDFKILSKQTIERDEFDLEPEVEKSFTVKITLTGNLYKAIDMFFQRIEHIEGEYYTTSFNPCMDM